VLGVFGWVVGGLAQNVIAKWISSVKK